MGGNVENMLLHAHNHFTAITHVSMGYLPPQDPSYKQEDLMQQFYCPHVPADGNQHIRIREKTLEFSSSIIYSVCLLMASSTRGLGRIHCIVHIHV